jgi:hypothetical protein
MAWLIILAAGLFETGFAVLLKLEPRDDAAVADGRHRPQPVRRHPAVTTNRG